MPKIPSISPTYTTSLGNPYAISLRDLASKGSASVGFQLPLDDSLKQFPKTVAVAIPMTYNSPFGVTFSSSVQSHAHISANVPFYPTSDSPRRTTSNLATLDYQVHFRSELDRQTKHLLEAISSAKDETIAALEAKYKQLRQDHSSLTRSHAELLASAAQLADDLSAVRLECDSMADLLSRRYTARRLFLISGLTVLAMSYSLALYFTHKTVIVHPLLAGIVLLCGIGFSVLSILRYRAERGEGK
ncbi:MAG: hypothetical protein JXQ73_25160 [Phycisphaerae bacterium]|nr:hypothetical protein [Phycisphaerae bacterium]